MLCIAPVLREQTVDTILKTIVIVRVDIAVMGRRDGVTALENLRDGPSLGLIRSTRLRCPILNDSRIAAVAPTARKPHLGVIARGLVPPKIQSQKTRCFRTVARRPHEQVDADLLAVPFQIDRKLPSANPRLNLPC